VEIGEINTKNVIHGVRNSYVVNWKYSYGFFLIPRQNY